VFYCFTVVLRIISYESRDPGLPGRGVPGTGLHPGPESSSRDPVPVIPAGTVLKISVLPGRRYHQVSKNTTVVRMSTAFRIPQHHTWPSLPYTTNKVLHPALIPGIRYLPQ